MRFLARRDRTAQGGKSTVEFNVGVTAQSTRALSLFVSAAIRPASGVTRGPTKVAPACALHGSDA